MYHSSFSVGKLRSPFCASSLVWIVHGLVSPRVLFVKLAGSYCLWDYLYLVCYCRLYLIVFSCIAFFLDRAVQFDLKQTSMMQRLWNGLVPSTMRSYSRLCCLSGEFIEVFLFCSRGSSVSVDAVSSVCLQEIGGDLYALSVCRDLKLRIWSVTVWALCILQSAFSNFSLNADSRMCRNGWLSCFHSEWQESPTFRRSPCIILILFMFRDSLIMDTYV